MSSHCGPTPKLDLKPTVQLNLLSLALITEKLMANPEGMLLCVLCSDIVLIGDMKKALNT